MKAVIAAILFTITVAANGQWNEVPIEDGPILKTPMTLMTFQNEDTIFVVSTFDIQGLYYSINSGDSFKFLYNLSSSQWGTIYYCRFVHKDTVLIVTSKGIYKKSLSKFDSPYFILKFSDYDTASPSYSAQTYFWNNDSGVVNSKYSFKTKDGGNTWQILNPGNPNTYYAGKRLIYFEETKRFIAVNGLILGESLDLGKTWNILFYVPDMTKTLFKQCADVSFLNNSKGFAVISNVIYKTDNEGKSWDSIQKYFSNDYVSIKFLDSLTGYALFNGKKEIMITKDGGKNWTAEFTCNSEAQGSDKLFYYNDSLFFATNGNRLYKRTKLSLSINPELKNPEWEVKLYPNPLAEVLIVELSGAAPENKTYLEIRDMQWRTVFKQTFETNNFTVDFSDKAAGLYFVNLSNGSNYHHARIVKTE